MKTVTVAVPALASKVLGTVAWICVEVMPVIVRFDCAVVFQRTCEPPGGLVEVGSERKFVPVMVMGTAALPAVAVLGLTLVIVGMGLAGGYTSKATGLERPLVPLPE